MPGAIIKVALAAWALFQLTLVGWLVITYWRDRRESRQCARLLEIGDAQFQAAEVALWRVGIDPCPEIGDLADEEFGNAIAGYFDWLNSFPVLKRGGLA